MCLYSLYPKLSDSFLVILGDKDQAACVACCGEGAEAGGGWAARAGLAVMGLPVETKNHRKVRQVSGGTDWTVTHRLLLDESHRPSTEEGEADYMATASPSCLSGEHLVYSDQCHAIFAASTCT